MVHVLIIGAAGMIGRKLAQRLAGDGELAGRQITTLSLVDITPPEQPAGFGGSLSSAALGVA
jgi:D-erythronate 2-dehydrogenase